MAINAARPTIGTVATLIIQAEKDLSILIRNDAADPVYLGGPEVLTSTGFTVPSGEAISLDLKGNDRLWGIATTNTVVQYIVSGL